MGAHWQGVARKAGYDPAKFTDAKDGEGLTAVVSLKNMKGAVIGDGTKCSGARCLTEQPEVEWAYVGAAVAYVAFKDGRKRRYLVNGLPKAQDRTMNIAGEEIRLRPASKTQTIKAFRKRMLAAPAERHGDRKPKGTRSRTRSMAGQLRNT